MTTASLAPRLRQGAISLGLSALGLASRAYVPGPHLHDAIARARRLERDAIACTIGYFNADTDAPAAIAAQGLAAIEALSDRSLRGHVSVKVPPMRYGADLVAALAHAAWSRGQVLHLDSHGPDTADATLALVDAVRAPNERWSVTIPGRWQRSPADADRAVARGMRVRVVKGQWACPAAPDIDLREGFLAVIDRLAGRATEVAVATHDAPLAREAISRLQRAGTPCELELLCGLPRRASLGVARELGVPVRMYVPYGQAWLPYALGQVVRQPRMLWWSLRDTLGALMDTARRRPG